MRSLPFLLTCILTRHSQVCLLLNCPIKTRSSWLPEEFSVFSQRMSDARWNCPLPSILPMNISPMPRSLDLNRVYSDPKGRRGFRQTGSKLREVFPLPWCFGAEAWRSWKVWKLPPEEKDTPTVVEDIRASPELDDHRLESLTDDQQSPSKKGKVQSQGRTDPLIDMPCDEQDENQDVKHLQQRVEDLQLENCQLQVDQQVAYTELEEVLRQVMALETQLKAFSKEIGASDLQQQYKSASEKLYDDKKNSWA